MVSHISTSTFHHTKFQQRQNVIFLPRSKHITHLYMTSVDNAFWNVVCTPSVYVFRAVQTNFQTNKKRAEMTTLFETDICTAVTRNRSCEAMPHMFCKESGMLCNRHLSAVERCTVYMMSTSNLPRYRHSKTIKYILWAFLFLRVHFLRLNFSQAFNVYIEHPVTNLRYFKSPKALYIQCIT